MKRCRILPIFIIIMLLCGRATCSNVSERQFQALDGDALLASLPDAVQADVTDGIEMSGSFWGRVKDLISQAVTTNIGTLREAAETASSLLVIVLLCAAAGTLAGEFGKRAVVLAGIAALFAGAASDIRSLVGAGANAIDELHTFSQMLLPVISGACAASGHATASAALYAGTSLFMQIMISFVRKILVPVVYAYLAMAAADAAVGGETMARIRKFLGATVKNSLRVILFLFGAFVSLTGVISGSADALALKAAKMTVSTVVPVVGGMVSDATETVLVSAKMVLQSVGVMGMLSVLSVILVPFLSIGVRYLLLQVTCAVCAAFGMKEHIHVLDAITSAVGYLLAMTVCCAVLCFVSCICFMRVGVF